MSTFVKKMSKFVRKNISFEVVEGNEKDTDKNTDCFLCKFYALHLPLLHHLNFPHFLYLIFFY